MKRNLEAKIKRLFSTPFVAWLLAALIVTGSAVMLILLHQNRSHDMAEMQRQVALRNSTITDRTKLTADMMAVLFSDVQTALAGTLSAVPREGTFSFLERWREINPLVSSALLINSRGTPEPGAHWPAEMVREYLDRKESLALDGTSWEMEMPPALKEWLATTPWLPGAVAEEPLSQSSLSAVREPLRDKLRIAASRDPYHVRGEGANPFPSMNSASSVGNLPPGNDYTTVETWTERRRRLGIPFAERTGWNSVPGALFAWRMCDDDMVLVVSVNLQELANMLAEALPAETSNGENYSIFREGNDKANAMRVAEKNQVRNDFVHEIPIHPELLPGWSARAILKAPGDGIFPGKTLYISSLVLVILAAVLAILLLFFFQKRIRENEATAVVMDYASHEMGTSVQEILCCTDPDALSSELADSENQSAHITREHAVIIYYASRRLSEAISLTLNFFPRIMRGTKISTENVDVCLVTGKLLEEFKAILQKTGVKMDWRVNLPTGDVYAMANDTAVSIILRSLIYNACLHTTVDKRIVDVSLVENVATGMVELRVRDYGPGVPRDEFERIFHLHWRSREEERGLGIGLPLSRKLARALGGDLVCEIPSDGKGGNVFILSLAKRK